MTRGGERGREVGGESERQIWGDSELEIDWKSVESHIKSQSFCFASASRKALMSFNLLLLFKIAALCCHTLI